MAGMMKAIQNITATEAAAPTMIGWSEIQGNDVVALLDADDCSAEMVVVVFFLHHRAAVVCLIIIIEEKGI